MVTVTLFILSGILNSVMDKITFNYKKSIFSNFNRQFWDIEVSWKNQYKDNLPPTTKMKSWWYLGLYKPRYQEKYAFSSTMLVWLTDAWHLSKTLMLLFMIISLVVYTPIINPVLDIILHFLAFTLPFTYTYEYILNKK